jgi:hypothetical protein
MNPCDASWVHQLMEVGGGRPWVFWKNELPYVFLSGNLDGEIHQIW